MHSSFVTESDCITLSVELESVDAVATICGGVRFWGSELHVALVVVGLPQVLKVANDAVQSQQRVNNVLRNFWCVHLLHRAVCDLLGEEKA